MAMVKALLYIAAHQVNNCINSSILSLRSLWPALCLWYFYMFPYRYLFLLDAQKELAEAKLRSQKSKLHSHDWKRAFDKALDVHELRWRDSNTKPVDTRPVEENNRRENKDTGRFPLSAEEVLCILYFDLSQFYTLSDIVALYLIGNASFQISLMLKPSFSGMYGYYTF